MAGYDRNFAARAIDRAKVLEFRDAEHVAGTCASHRISIVYVGPGFASAVPLLSASLMSLDLLSVGALPQYVPQGVVLAFGMDAGKPKCWVHLGQAQAQNVKFAARFLKLATIYE